MSALVRRRREQLLGRWVCLRLHGALCSGVVAQVWPHTKVVAFGQQVIEDGVVVQIGEGRGRLMVPVLADDQIVWIKEVVS